MSLKNLYLTCSCLLLSISANAGTENQLEEQYDEIDYASCRKSAIGTIENQKKETKINKWVDENGRTHFGARPPSSGKSQQIVNNTNVTNYFKLSFGKESKVPGYKPLLVTNIRNVYKTLVSIVGQSNFKQTHIRLNIFEDKSEFLSFRNRYSNNRTSVTGFHNGQKNIVGVWERNKSQAIKTSIHEATHVITRGNFGRLPRWLNEGIAEYMEPIHSQLQTVYVKPHTAWLKHIEPPYLSVSDLLSSKRSNWRGENSNVMYAYSWALVYFLLSNDHRKDILAKYLQKAAAQPCGESVGSVEFFNKEYPAGISQIQIDFEKWLDVNSFRSHYFY